jgi:CBS domain-containing protein
MAKEPKNSPGKSGAAAQKTNKSRSAKPQTLDPAAGAPPRSEDPPARWQGGAGVTNRDHSRGTAGRGPDPSRAEDRALERSGGLDTQVQEIMTRNFEVIRPDTTVREAAERMRALNVGSLPVCDGDRLVGVLTDRDITVRAVAAGRDPAQTRVGDVMTAEVHTCFLDQPAGDAARLMQAKQVRRLPVVDHGGRLVGVVSLGDLAVSGGDDRLTGETLERVSESSPPRR